MRARCDRSAGQLDSGAADNKLIPTKEPGTATLGISSSGLRAAPLRRQCRVRHTCDRRHSEAILHVPSFYAPGVARYIAARNAPQSKNAVIRESDRVKMFEIKSGNWRDPEASRKRLAATKRGQAELYQLSENPPGRTYEGAAENLFHPRYRPFSRMLFRGVVQVRITCRSTAKDTLKRFSRGLQGYESPLSESNCYKELDWTTFALSHYANPRQVWKPAA